MVLMKCMKWSAMALGTLLVLAAPRAQAQDSGIAVGTKAPGAAVETLDGKPVELASVFGKGPVLIEFWATWCPNCKELEPTMLAVQKKFAGKVTFVGVAVSVNESPRAVQAYAEKHALMMTHFFDRRGKAVDAFEVPATSFVVVLNKAGEVVYTGLGGRQNLEAAIRKGM
ncbi:MAG TPA: TlpA disulfide reductase family protein [Ramlibacter sp.]|nr:TlpA disulfide reductase family protein [Ramlibacter sp.]